MSKLKVQRSKVDGEGFTIIELLVVLSIMGLFLGVFLANFAGLRDARNLKIAQNEMVSNIRKLQGYTLSSRALKNGRPAQFYILKLDTASKKTYSLEAIYDVEIAPKLMAGVENFLLPDGVIISSFSLDRPPFGGIPDAYDSPPAPVSCVLVASKLPFGKTILNNGCTFSNFTTDSYSKVKDFVTNNPEGTASDNSILVITLSTVNGSLSKTVTVNGVSGAITFQK